MKVLLLDPLGVIEPRLSEIACKVEDVVLLGGEHACFSPGEPLRVDAIVGGGDLKDRTSLVDLLIQWRSHPHTYLVPCWITDDAKEFEKVCLWPRVGVDRFEREVRLESFCDWLSVVSAWQQSRMNLPSRDLLAHHSPLELITSLALRRANGKLFAFDDDGNNAMLVFREGALEAASVRHLKGEEAFYDFFSWTRGSYLWVTRESAEAGGGERQALSLLINQGLRLFREANFLYHFVPGLDVSLMKTQSESALDDGGDRFYAALTRVYGLIDGRATVSDIIRASSMSRLRTMGRLAKWFSLGDIQVGPGREETEPKRELARLAVAELVPRRRILLVDDSLFMCKVLESIFLKDSRFEIVGIAHDGVEALDLIEKYRPDVVTLDIQMPRMDGLTALKHIMIRYPTPVVVLSAMTKETSYLTYQSFRYGAVSVFTKPSSAEGEGIAKETERLVESVWHASQTQLESVQYIRRSKKAHSQADAADMSPSSGRPQRGSELPVFLVVAGAGGFPSVLKLLMSVSRSPALPFIMVCMAMPRLVVEAFIPNLQKDCSIRIEKPSAGGVLHRGACYLFSVDDRFHLMGRERQIALGRVTAGGGNGGSFDLLLGSAAEKLGKQAVGVLISGKGADGLEGMRQVQRKGGSTYVLSPRVCLSPDLPRCVLESGYGREVASVRELIALFGL